MGDNVGTFDREELIRFENDLFEEIAFGALRGRDAPAGAENLKLQYGIDVTQIDEIYRSSCREHQIDGEFVKRRCCAFGDIVWEDDSDIDVALGPFVDRTERPKHIYRLSRRECLQDVGDNGLFH